MARAESVQPATAAASSDAMDAFYTGMAAKDRTNVEKHLAAVDAEGGPGHGRLWRHIATALRRLAPHAIQTVGQQIVQFFIADGKYRMQVFTLEDKRDGALVVYLPDVLDAAIRAKVLAKPGAASRGAAGHADDSDLGGDASDVHPVEYPLAGKKGETLAIEQLTSGNTPDPPAHVRHMLGWNRKALRIKVPSVGGVPAQAAAIEALCELAAKAWAGKAEKTQKPEKPEKPAKAAAR